MLRNEIEIGLGGDAQSGSEGQDDAGNQKGSALTAPTAPAEKPKRRKRASRGSTPIIETPASEPYDGRDGQWISDTQSLGAVSTVVSQLIGLQRQRQFCIVQKNRSERAIEAMISSMMGFRLDATEKDRKAVFARAKAFRLAVERGGEGHAGDDIQTVDALSAAVPLIIISAANRKPWVEMREETEKTMRKLAQHLPVYEFAQSVRGFGALGLACLVAEAGQPEIKDGILGENGLGDYRTVSGLWKRMGLAVFDGKRQQKCRDKAEAAVHGYSPRRRSEVWAFCSDAMFRNQWKGADEDTGELAGPLGPYGEVYARRRAVTDPRIEATAYLSATDPAKWTKARCHNDARRVMSKALLRDLWRVWNGMPPRGSGDAE